MKTNHLTFGQLLKLESANNLCRVTRAYHRALQNAWDISTPGQQLFMVSTAEFRFPGIARRYRPVLDFIRSFGLKQIVRRAAVEQQIPHLPGANIIIRTCEWWTATGEQTAYGLAHICKSFVEACGIPAKITRTRGAFAVHAETNSYGAAILRRKPGVKVESLKQYCDDGNMNFEEIFWWYNLVPPGNWRVNPVLRCVNTPDAADNALEIVYGE
jgi:hypothetical protein